MLVSGWIAYEYLFLNGEISFPWLVLGNGFSMDVKLVQWYEYTGALGGSLWVLVVNLLVFEAWKRRREPVRWIAPAVALLLPAVVSLIMYATYEEPSERTKITVVQPNIDPYHEKFVLKQSEQNELLIGLMDQAPQDADLIVAPETAIDEYFWEEYLERTPSMLLFHDFIRQRKPGTMVVTGANTYVPYDSEETASPTARERGGQWYDVFNTALGLDSTEAIEIHHKGKLVIGAEMLPYYSVIRKWKFLFVDLGGLSGQIGYGKVRKVFTAPGGVRAGPAICYEAVYGEYFTEFVRNGAQVMCVISNDGWWRDTPGHRYLFAYSRLRAVENRRSIARQRQYRYFRIHRPARRRVAKTRMGPARSADRFVEPERQDDFLYPLRGCDRSGVELCVRAGPALFHGLPFPAEEPYRRLKVYLPVFARKVLFVQIVFE